MQLNAVSTVNALSYTSRYPLPDCPRGLSSGFPCFDMKLITERVGRATAMARGARSRAYDPGENFLSIKPGLRLSTGNAGATVNTASNSHQATGRYQ